MSSSDDEQHALPAGDEAPAELADGEVIDNQVEDALTKTEFKLIQYCSKTEVIRLLEAPKGCVDKADDISILGTLSKFGTTEQLVDGQQVLKIEIEYSLKNNCPLSDGHFSSHGPALSKLSRAVRHSILHGIGIDIDQAQAGASILCALATKFGLVESRPALKQLVAHPAEIIQRVVVENSCKTMARAKELIHIAMCDCHQPRTPFLGLLHAEVYSLVDQLLDLSWDYDGPMSSEFSTLFEDCASYAEGHRNRVGSTFARVSACLSRRLTTVLMHLLKKDGHTIIGYENDGCQVLLEPGTADRIAESLAAHSKQAAEACQLPDSHIKFVVKPMQGQMELLVPPPGVDDTAAHNAQAQAPRIAHARRSRRPANRDAQAPANQQAQAPTGGGIPAAGVGAAAEDLPESLLTRLLREQPKFQCDPQTQQRDAANLFLEEYGGHIKFDGATGYIRLETRWAELGDNDSSLQALVQNINFYVSETKSLNSSNSGVVGISAMISRQAQLTCQSPGFTKLAHQSVKAKVKQRHECCSSSVLWCALTRLCTCSFVS